MPGGPSVLLAIVSVFLIVMLVVLFVLNNSTKKPQSPQALVAAAVQSWFAPPQEWKPGMGPQPLIYHPAAQQLMWKPLPEAFAGEKNGGRFESTWRPLPDAAPLQAPPVNGNGGIRAYTGPAR